jgi:sugar/nucleoside kinase (ribokinase family)
MNNMKAIEISGIRDVQLIKRTPPQITDPNDVIVKIKSVGICGTDIHTFTGDHPFVKPPVVIGHECCGEIVECGSEALKVKQGERIFHYWRSAAAAKKYFEYPDSDKIIEKLAEYDGIYLSGISLAILTPTSRTTLINRFKELSIEGTAIYFDCNYRSHLWPSKEHAKEAYEQLYKVSEIVFLTTEEAEILLDVKDRLEAHSKLKTLGALESVLKDGGKPCTIFSDNSVIEVPAQIVLTVVDTTAAGDSFSASYLVARRFNCSPADAAKMAHKTAAYVVCHKGAIAPIEEMPVKGQDVTGCTK